MIWVDMNMAAGFSRNVGVNLQANTLLLPRGVSSELSVCLEWR